MRASFKFFILFTSFFFSFFLFFGSALGLQPASPASPANFTIPNYTATYSISAYGLSLGQSTQSFKIFNKNYIFSIDTQASALFYSDSMVQTSQGFLNLTNQNNFLIPEKFNSYRDRKNQNESIIFDWNKNTAHSETSRVNNKNFSQEDQDINLSPGVGDVLSIQMDLRAALFNYFKNLDINNIKNLNNLSFKFTLIKSNKLQVYNFKILGLEKLKLKNNLTPDSAALSTLKIERLSSADGSKIDFYWLAPSYNYLLVQSEQAEKNLQNPKAPLNITVILSLEKYTPDF